MLTDETLDRLTDAEATRVIKAALRKAFPATKFTVSMRGWRIVRWTDDGPTVEQVQAALVAAGIGEFDPRYEDKTVCVRGSRLSLDRYNAAERAAAEQERTRRAEEDERWRQREAAAVHAAKLARRDVMRVPPWSGLRERDPAQDAKACAAFEELRQRAETDVGLDDERQYRPSWSPPLIIEGELLETCIALGLLRADDKPIVRLWATFADPRKLLSVLREHNARHGMPDISCRGFQLHAGSERGPVSDILFEAQRQPSGAWRFGPRRYHHDFVSPRHREWERLVRQRERYREIDPRQIPRLDEQIAAIDAEDLAAAQAHNSRLQLRERAVELARARVLDFSSAPGLQMQLAGRLTEHCHRCWRELTDPISLERGIGPDCLAIKIRFICSLAAKGRSVRDIAYVAGMPSDFVEAILAEATA